MMMMILDVRYRSGHLLGNPFVKRGGGRDSGMEDWICKRDFLCGGKKRGDSLIVLRKPRIPMAE